MVCFHLQLVLPWKGIEVELLSDKLQNVLMVLLEELEEQEELAKLEQLEQLEQFNVSKAANS